MNSSVVVGRPTDQAEVDIPTGGNFKVDEVHGRDVYFKFSIQILSPSDDKVHHLTKLELSVHNLVFQEQESLHLEDFKAPEPR